MYLVRIPHITKWLYPSQVWSIPTEKPVLFLTFDDGPDPGVTPEVLMILDQYNAKATFFCVGEKAGKHQDLLENITQNGHIIGNHTNNHLNGKKTTTDNYIKNVNKASQILHTEIFRPPYGKITRKQTRKLRNKFKIIMWSVLPGDFDKNVSKEDLLKRAIKHTTKGSIIVFHDNYKFKENMIYALKGFLEHFHGLGFRFEALTNNYLSK